jgi:hypothetical protein
MCVTTIQAAAGADSGRSGGLPTVWTAISASCYLGSNLVFVTAVQAAAGVDFGRSGGFPAVWTVVILCVLQLFKLLTEWILENLADLLFGL